jgi:hypothetical protein
VYALLLANDEQFLKLTLLFKNLVVSYIHCADISYTEFLDYLAHDSGLPLHCWTYRACPLDPSNYVRCAGAAMCFAEQI